MPTIIASSLKACGSLLVDEFDLVSVVEDGRAMVSAAKKLQPDIIVADIAMPRLNGIDAFIQLRKEMPRVKAIFLTMHQEVAYARRALEAGALGFVLKHAAPAELIMAIHTALNGNVYITPSLTGEILHAMRSGPQMEGRPGDRTHSAPTGDSPIPCRRTLSQRNRRRPRNLRANGGVS